MCKVTFAKSDELPEYPQSTIFPASPAQMSAEDTLTNKSVVVCGLLYKKTCFCEQCQSSGSHISLPDALRDTIMHKFNEQIRHDRLEKLGTYAQDFGDNKIVRKGEETVYVRFVAIRGENFSVMYKLRIQNLTAVGRTGDADHTSSFPTTHNSLHGTNSQQRLLRQFSQG